MAAANTVEVRRPKVTIEGEAIDTITYKATAPVSSFFTGSPSIDYSFHKAGGDRVESPTAKELIEKIAQAQTAMFAPPVSKTMVITDGAGNISIFTGYDTGPHHSIMFGGVSNGRSLVHRCARLFFINTSIYIPPDGKNQEPDGRAMRLLAEAKNPCEALKIVLKQIIADYNKLADNEDKQIRDRIDAANQKIFEEEWYPILDASTDVILPSFDRIASSAATQLKLYKTIRDVYLSGAADFSVIISQFASMFQMVFIPGHMGIKPGKFISAANMLSAPEEKEVNIVSLSMTPGPKKFLVPTAVVVKGLPEGTGSGEPDGRTKRQSGRGIISWPEDLPTEGQILVIHMPSWLPSDLFPKTVTKEGTDLDANKNLDLVKQLMKEALDLGDVVIKICAYIARLTYDSISLGDATASIVCPLNITWELGKRYTIKQPSTTSGGSEVLFSGFLRDVRHNISSTPSKPEATTQLTFSHVEANGFTLPNK